ncbi:MAG: SDR family oxidoreductase [Salaquimonas sp.]
MSDAYAKRALITGASMGLGEALALQLSAQGWHLTTIDREADALAGHDPTPDHIYIQCNLSDATAVDALVEQLSSGAAFDLVIMNAATSASGKFENMPFSAYQKLVALNAETPMVMAADLGSKNKFTKGANLVFISSLSHYTGYPGASVYAATKDAIAVYAKSIRKPFAKRGISVSCVFPGPLKTSQAERHSPRGAKAEKRMSPEEAARLILKNVFSGRHLIMPGAGSKTFALFGKLLPSIADRVMRKIIYEKLDRDVY